MRLIVDHPLLETQRFISIEQMANCKNATYPEIKTRKSRRFFQPEIY